MQLGCKRKQYLCSGFQKRKRLTIKIVFTMSRKRTSNWLEDLAALEDFYPMSFNDVYNHEVYKCALIQYR